jgi:hypothetical protein
MTFQGMAVLAAGVFLLGGCNGSGDGDGGAGGGGAGGAGGSGGMTTIPAPTVSATIGFDVCSGCRVGGAGGPCMAPSRYYCGVAGAECVECPAPGECEIGLCLDGQCAVFVAPDGASCGLGLCTSGKCTD